MSQQYYLYLDESGDFKNDDKPKRKKEWSPSLIGGVLLKNTLPESKLKKIFMDEVSHANEEERDIVFEKFKTIDELDLRYVIFCNEECIKVVNNNLTYQNIMTEGIVQLMRKLKSMEDDGKIFLHIHIASRLIIGDHEKNVDGRYQKKVPVDAYVERLQERLIMEVKREDIEKAEWEISVGSARTEEMLMIADIICNTYLTQKTKFVGAKYDKLREVYADERRTYYFSVFQTSVSHIFQESMADGRIGEAIAVICQSEDSELIEKLLATVKERLEDISEENLRVQYSYISALVTHFINIEKNYDKSIRLLNNLLEYFIPIYENIEKDKKLIAQLKLDLNFYLLTIYTHIGNVKKSKECIAFCDNILAEMPLSVEMIDYKIRYMNRTIINKINEFEFDEAKAECEKLVETCKEIKEILGLIAEKSEFTYEELGKAYSSLAQIDTFLLRERPELYSEAVQISDCAISEMQSEFRQYQYRAILETEAGYYNKAFSALLVAAEIAAPKDVDWSIDYTIKSSGEQKQLCKTMVSQMTCNKNVYLVTNYIRLMSEGKLHGWQMSDVMFEQYNSSQVCKELMEVTNKQQHPYEIIYWKLATYFAEAKSWKAATDNYKKALQICLKDENEITLRKIGFAIELEQYAYALKNGEKGAKKSIGNLKKHYEILKEDTILQDMKELFADFKEDVNDWKIYFDMSRRISY